MTIKLSSQQLDRLAVEEFFARYVTCLDDLRLEEWPNFFTEDGEYGLWPRENYDADLPAPMFLCRNQRQMKDRVLAYREANIFPDFWNRILISSTDILETSETAIVSRSNYAVLQTRLEGETFVFQAGRSHDTFVRNGDELLLKQRKLIYDTLAVRTLFVLPI